MLRTNIEKTVIQSVQGKIHHPVSSFPYRINSKGTAEVLPATGGITYNVKLGDPAFGWSGDHVEPGVSIRNEETHENNALMLLSCIGNECRVVSGDAKGAKGFVIGKHGGIEHVLVQFADDDLEKMAVDDKILVKAWGQGLKLLDYPDVMVMNIDPNLFLKLPIKEENGILKVPVVAEVPAKLMGSGLGAQTAFSGDYDIMTQDEEEIKKYGLSNLRFGDLVLLQDCDNTYGRCYKTGAVSIGVVVHSDCIKMGHGPGVTVIMTCKESKIEGYIDKNANIKNYIKL